MHARVLLAFSLLMLGLSVAGVGFAGSSADVNTGPNARWTEMPEVEVLWTPTPIPRPTVSGAPVQPIAITSDGCCAYPGWSKDSEWILFFDAPDGGDTRGLYTIPRSGGPATRLTDRIGSFSSDWTLVAYPESERVYIERWQDGERWTVPSSGRAVHFSPSSQSIAWQIGSSSIQNPDVRVRSIWVSGLKGEDARELVTVHGGELIGWAEDEQALIVTGRLTPTGPAGIWRINIEDGAGRLLFEADRLRDALLSNDGMMLAFIIAFEQNPERNGVWILRTDDGSARRLEFFGSYRWRSSDQLLLVPLDLDASSPYLLQYDSGRDLWWTLTTPQETVLPIANNDWRISPNGRWLVYQSFLDRNLYLLELPSASKAP
ncbi:MAG: hypothetical protein P8X64_14730 [Anaerolineales bacterium]